MRTLLSKSLVLALALTLSLAGTAAQAGCYADYKAKKDNPLKLHYGVAQIAGDQCNKGAAQAQIAARIAADGWRLLTVLSIFDDSGLAERKASAGKFFLRY
ncbi:MAG TPA: hypothetical protein ENK83_02380 [Aliiroseovarius sp.]|nr:hypothetical protein [Aliiroseovarius sp.]